MIMINMGKLVQLINKSIAENKILWLSVCAILLSITLMDSTPYLIRLISGLLLFVVLIILGSNVC